MLASPANFYSRFGNRCAAALMLLTAGCHAGAEAFRGPGIVAPVTVECRSTGVETAGLSIQHSESATACSITAPSPGCSSTPLLAHSSTPTPCLTLRDDLDDFLPRLRDDAAGLVSWHNGLLWAAAAGGAIAIREGLDDDVREYTAEHPDRWGDGSRVFGKMGEPQYQIPVILSIYGYSLYQDDPELHDYATTLISAYTLTGIGTTTLKGIIDTDRPSREWNDGRYGFPSYHTASCFAAAAVTEEYHGLLAAVPLYTLSGLIGWTRLDERDHDLSDVVFGAFMGWAIGKSVAAERLYGDGRVRLAPYIHPTEAAHGLAVEFPF